MGLGERDFVFLDNAQIPWLCREWGGQVWLFRWLDRSRQWVSFRQCKPMEEIAFPRNLPREQQELYFVRVNGG